MKKYYILPVVAFFTFSSSYVYAGKDGFGDEIKSDKNPTVKKKHKVEDSNDDQDFHDLHDVRFGFFFSEVTLPNSEDEEDDAEVMEEDTFSSRSSPLIDNEKKTSDQPSVSDEEEDPAILMELLSITGRQDPRKINYFKPIE